MQVHQFSDHSNFGASTVATLGTFDGVHLGHQKILNDLVEESEKLELRSAIDVFECRRDI